MNLYAWQPRGHGQLSFFVAAGSLEEAVLAVERYIALHKKATGRDRISDYAVQGWGTDYYELTVMSPGEVIEHAND